MNNRDESQITHLWEKFRSNSLTAEEFDEFVELLKDYEEGNDLLIDDQAKMDWKDSRPLLEHIHSQQRKVVRKRQLMVWMGSAAAAIALILSAWYLWPDSIPGDVRYRTSFAETQPIVLPDGSKVLLNANSSITWSGDWMQKEKRSVILEGEAFFEVMNIDNTPFEVTTPDVKINVLGTEFNVKARGHETNVYLHSGKVHLDVAGYEEEVVEMQPGDFVRYDLVDNKLTTTGHNRLQERASWVDGMLEFQNESVPKILEEFENLYGKTFLLENSDLVNKRMDLSLPYTDWDLVRNALEIALDVEFTSSDETIIVK